MREEFSVVGRSGPDEEEGEVAGSHQQKNTKQVSNINNRDLSRQTILEGVDMVTVKFFRQYSDTSNRVYETPCEGK